MGRRLSKTTTRTGDADKTGLSDGSRVDKDTPRMEAIGTVDEPGSHIGFGQGLIPMRDETKALREMLTLVQHDLFDPGGALSRPGADLLSAVRISEIPDSDYAKSRTAVSVIPGHLGHG